MSEKLELPDVTLVLVDTACHALSRMSLESSMEKVDFGDIVVFSDRQNTAPLGAMHVPVEAHSIDDAMRLLWYHVPRYVVTSHVLVQQWDSWVVDPTAWDDKFLEYDYVGAAWGWHHGQYEVGNGGFSLRSAKLMRHIADDQRSFVLFADKVQSEDDRICRTFRPELEVAGFRFAPVAVADQFSFERRRTACPKFGYHGMFNWPHVLNDVEIEIRMRCAPPYVKDSLHCRQMVELLPKMGRPVPRELRS